MRWHPTCELLFFIAGQYQKRFSTGSLVLCFVPSGRPFGDSTGRGFPWSLANGWMAIRYPLASGFALNNSVRFCSGPNIICFLTWLLPVRPHVAHSRRECGLCVVSERLEGVSAEICEAVRVSPLPQSRRDWATANSPTAPSAQYWWDRMMCQIIFRERLGGFPHHHTGVRHPPILKVFRGLVSVRAYDLEAER